MIYVAILVTILFATTLSSKFAQTNKTTTSRPETTTKSTSTSSNHVPNWVLPQDDMLSYDVTEWVGKLALQTCAIVEIGEDFCAMFVEVQGSPNAMNDDLLRVQEYFLGVAECACIRTWTLCVPALARQRKDDCIFREAMEFTESSARVHRRLCDITGISQWANQCNCTGHTLAGKPLQDVIGFPMCFRSPLPSSICSPRSVCGVATCSAFTVQGKVHTVRCHESCHGRQPFCEEPDHDTTKPREIRSQWSDWSAPQCNTTCGAGVLLSEARCLDIETGNAAIDCLGPGTMCCTPELGDCTCSVSIRDNCLTVTRTSTKSCVEKRGCDIDYHKRSTGNEPSTFQVFFNTLFRRKPVTTTTTTTTTPAPANASSTPSNSSAPPATATASLTTPQIPAGIIIVNKTLINDSALLAQIATPITIIKPAILSDSVPAPISDTGTRDTDANDRIFHNPELHTTIYASLRNISFGDYTAPTTKPTNSLKDSIDHYLKMISTPKYSTTTEESLFDFDKLFNPGGKHDLRRSVNLGGPRKPYVIDPLVKLAPDVITARPLFVYSTMRATPHVWKSAAARSPAFRLQRTVDSLRQSKDLEQILGLDDEHPNAQRIYGKSRTTSIDVKPAQRKLLVFYPRDEFTDTDGSEFDYHHQERVEQLLFDVIDEGI